VADVAAPDDTESAYPFPLPAFEPNPQPQLLGSSSEKSKKVHEGPCQPDPITGCITSPGYPEDYAIDMTCTIPKDLGRGRRVKLLVEAFDTEVGYDYLEVNQKTYSGVASPNGIEPTTDLLWVSDDDVGGKGWKICPEEV